MKKILIALSISASIVLFTGCSRSLQEENVRIPTADSYYKTARGFNDLVNACYPFLRSYFGMERGFVMTVLGTDIWGHGYGSNAAYNQYNAGILPSDGNYWNVWSNFYQGISTCNTVISRAPEVEGISQADLNARIGEALFLRAVYYHILVMQWGPIPLKVEELTEVETTATRASEEAVYNQIVEDLLLAEEYLPNQQSDYGRPRKAAAQALLARVYLTINKNTEAAIYAKKVIHEHDFALLDDYADVWDIENQRNAEVIWAVQYTKDLRLNQTGNWSHLYFLMEYDFERGLTLDLANGRSWVRYFPSRYFLNMLSANRWRDSRYDKTWKEVWYANNPSNLLPEMQMGDTALYVVPHAVSQQEKTRVANKYSLYDINDIYNGENPIGKRSRWPTLNKFIDPLRTATLAVEGTRDWFVFRLSEMYLIAAEALMKEDKALEGLDYINAVRARAAWPGHEEDMKISVNELTLDFILDERAFELCGEMLRWPDLKRTGKLIERVKLYNPDARNNITEMHLLRPIPTNMIDRLTNKDEFPQNSGY